MKDRFAKISFLATGHVIQDILITDPSITPELLTAMLNNGDAATTVEEGKEVCATVGDWLPIGEVVYIENELEYNSFQLEDSYTLTSETALQPFNATRLALHHAVGEYIDEPEMTIDEVIKVLGQYAYSPPVMAVHENVEGWTGKDILSAIEADKHDLINLMTIAHTAGKKGMELI